MKIDDFMHDRITVASTCRAYRRFSEFNFIQLESMGGKLCLRDEKTATFV